MTLTSNPILPLKFVAQEIGVTEHHLRQIAHRQRGQTMPRISLRVAMAYPRFVRKGPRRWGVYLSEWEQWNQQRQEVAR